MVSQQDDHTKIFISYSQRDKHWLERLLVHLRPLERDHGVEIWDDTKIKPGSIWMQEIQAALESAQVAILLVSADFLGSDFISKDELPPLLKAAQDRGVEILPLILSPCGFLRNEALSQFQAFNNSRPLINLDRGGQEQVLEKVAAHVEDLLRSKSKKRVSKRAQPIVKYDPPQKAETKLTGETPVNDATGNPSLPNEKGKGVGVWPVVSVVILSVLIVLVIIYINRISRSPKTLPANTNSGTGQSNTQPPQIPIDNKTSVTIGVGDTASIWSDSLSIIVEKIVFDPDSNKFKVSAAIWSPNHKVLVIPDQEASDEIEYSYFGNGSFKIRVSSATATAAEFSVRRSEN